MKTAIYQHHVNRSLIGEGSYLFYLILIASATVLITMIVSLASHRFESEPNIFDISIDSPFLETSNDFSPVN